MSAPRPICPGAIYLVTRRCTQGQLLLRPDPLVNQLVAYSVGEAAAATGVKVHAVCVLSNHIHVVATDVRGNLPVFQHRLDTFIAKCMNVHLGRKESFWAPGSYNQVRLVDETAVLDKMLYCYLQAVEAGLVANAKDWPGFHSLPVDLDAEPIRVERPKVFFRENGSLPKQVTLQFSIPEMLGDDPAATKRHLIRELRTRELEIQARMKASGRRFLGRRRVLAQSPFKRIDIKKPRGIVPRVASRIRENRVRALKELNAFVEAYREARLRYRNGDRSTVFPYGTYWMRVHLGVVCADP